MHVDELFISLVSLGVMTIVAAVAVSQVRAALR